MEHDERPVFPLRADAARAFEKAADTIMYRWQTERNTWVSTHEVEQARAYLAGLGVASAPLPDGQFAVNGESPSTIGAAHLVLLGLKHLQAARKSRTRF